VASVTSTLALDPAAAAAVAPLALGLDGDRVSALGGGACTVVAVLGVLMDRNEMATQVMLAREGAATAGVVADMGLGTIGVVGGHVGLEVELTSKGCGVKM
jgi:hypothetical protein